MKQFLKPLAVFVGMGLTMVIFFQNCDQQHTEVAIEEDSRSDRQLGDFTACEQALFDHFELTYKPAFETVGCRSCHKIGGLRTVSPFADSDSLIAFDDFFRKGPNAISSKVIDEGHNSGSLGYNKDSFGAELEDFRAEWGEISTACIASDTSLETSGLTTDFFDETLAGNVSSSFCEFNDPIAIDAVTGEYSLSQPRTSVLTWDLGEFRDDLDGVIISLSIRPNSPTIFGGGTHACPNETGYRAGRLSVTSDKPLRIKNIHVRIDGGDKGVRDFLLERSVAAGAIEEDVFGSGSSLVTFPMSIFSGEAIVIGNAWSLYFEELEVVVPEPADPDEP